MTDNRNGDHCHCGTAGTNRGRRWIGLHDNDIVVGGLAARLVVVVVLVEDELHIGFAQHEALPRCTHRLRRLGQCDHRLLDIVVAHGILGDESDEPFAVRFKRSRAMTTAQRLFEITMNTNGLGLEHGQRDTSTDTALLMDPGQQPRVGPVDK